MLSFVNAKRGWLVASPGQNRSRPAIYMTRDEGRHSVKQITFPATVYSSSLDMVSTQDGWAIISNTLYKTTDGGVHWFALALPVHVIPYQRDFSSAITGWVVVGAAAGPVPETLLARLIRQGDIDQKRSNGISPGFSL